MPRRKTIDPANETAFSHRFCQLMDSHQPKLTQEEMGKILGVSKSSIGFYRSGTNQPNYSILIRIANFFHCSTDYLLGVSDYRGIEPQLRMICDYTGLSEYAVKDLRRIFTDCLCDDLTKDKRRSVFSCFVEAVDFPDLLDSVQDTREQCDNLYLSSVEALPVDSLSLEALAAAEHDIRQDLDRIDYQLYKITAYWRQLVVEIIGTDEVTNELKKRLGKIRDRWSQLSTEQFLQQFKEGKIHGLIEKENDQRR